MMKRLPRNKQIGSRITVGCSLLVLLAFAGCAGKGDDWRFAKTWDMRRAVGLKSKQPEPPQNPVRLVTTWTDTVLHTQGERPQRGFGGRLTFFGRENETPIRVDGQLVVYAYDEANREPHENQPTRRYIFPREQFVRHESLSETGASYSVWLPWDAVGGERKNISLIARFQPHDGPMIVGEPTRHLLPGTGIAMPEPTPVDNSVSLAQHVGANPEASILKTGATSVAAESSETNPAGPISIPISKSLRRRLLEE